MAINTGIPNDIDKILFAEDCMHFAMFDMNKVKLLCKHESYREYVYNAFNISVLCAFRFLDKRMKMHYEKMSRIIKEESLNRETFISFATHLADKYFFKRFDADIFLNYCVYLTALAVHFYNNGVTEAPNLAIDHIYCAFKVHDMTNGGWSFLNRIAEQYAFMEKCYANMYSPKSVWDEVPKNLAEYQVNVCSWKSESTDKLTRDAQRYFETINKITKRDSSIAQDSMNLESPQTLISEVPENPSQNAAESEGNLYNAKDELNDNSNTAEESYVEIFNRFYQRFTPSAQDSMNMESPKSSNLDKDLKNPFSQNFVKNQGNVYEGKASSRYDVTGVMQGSLTANENVANPLESTTSLILGKVTENSFAPNSEKNPDNVDDGKTLTTVVQSYLVGNEKVANPLKRSLTETEPSCVEDNSRKYIPQNLKLPSGSSSSIFKDKMAKDIEEDSKASNAEQTCILKDTIRR